MSEYTTRVFIADTLTMDNYIDATPAHNGDLKSNAEIWFAGLQRAGIWDKNDKGDIDKVMYVMLNDLIAAGLFGNVDRGVGGSWGNTFSNMSNGLARTGHKFIADIFTAVSTGVTGALIREKLKEQGNINIIPKLSEEDLKDVHSAASFNFMYPEDGKTKKKIAAGKAEGKEKLTVEHVREAFANNRYHVVMISGNAVEKLGKDVAYAILEEAIKQNCHILLSCATKPSPEAKEFFSKALPYAKVASFNETEAGWYYDTNTKDEKGKTVTHIKEALVKAQEDFAGSKVADPIRVITDGPNGAYGLMPTQELIQVGLWDPTNRGVEMTGAGDAFLAGVLAMILKGFDNYKSLHTALQGGAIFSDAIIKQTGTRLSKDDAPELLARVEKDHQRWVRTEPSSKPVLMQPRGEAYAIAP